MTHPTTDSPGAVDAPLPAARRALRPLGYLLVALVWTALTLTVLALGPGVLVWVALDGTLTVGGIAADLAASPGELVAFVLCVPLLVLIWGPGVLGVLTAATWPLAALSTVYVVRSFDRRYAREPLSGTRYVGAGQATGLPTAFAVALSLQPVRPTRATDLLMRWYVTGWQPRAGQLVAMLPAGAAWLLCLVGLAQDLPGAVRAGLLLAAAGLAAWSVVWSRRVWRRRFDGGAPASDVPVSALDAGRRRARLAAARARRDARGR